MKHLIETRYFNLTILTKHLYLLPDFQIYNSKKVCLYIDFRFLFLFIRFVIPKRTNFQNFNMIIFQTVLIYAKNYVRLIILNHEIFTYYKNGR